jgi:hypothetical protein
MSTGRANITRSSFRPRNHGVQKLHEQLGIFVRVVRCYDIPATDGYRRRCLYPVVVSAIDDRADQLLQVFQTRPCRIERGPVDAGVTHDISPGVLFEKVPLLLLGGNVGKLHEPFKCAGAARWTA